MTGALSRRDCGCRVLQPPAIPFWACARAALELFGAAADGQPFAAEVIPGFLDVGFAVAVDGDERYALHLELSVRDQCDQRVEVLLARSGIR